MKKFALLALGISILNTSYAQLYLRAGAGYALPQAGQTIDGSGTPYNGSSSFTTYAVNYSVKPASFSSGTQAALGLGYLFTDHVGIQVDFTAGLSNTKYSFTYNNVSYSSGQANVTNTMQAKTPIMAIPSLVLQTGESSSVNLYGRFGVALPLSSDIDLQQSIFFPSTLNRFILSYKMKPSFSIGVHAAVGAQYKLSDKMTIWGEVSMLSKSLYIKEATLKSASANGVSYPVNTIGVPVTVNYGKNVIVDTNETNQPTYSLPFSNIGLNVGVSFTLTEKRHAKHTDAADKNKPYKRR